AHGGLEVVVADGAAGDAGRTRAGSALIEHEDVLAPAQSAGPQIPGQVPGGRQAVDARADDDVPAMSADHGTRLSIKGARQHRIHATARAPPAGRHGGGGELPGPVRTERYSPERAGCLLPHSRGPPSGAPGQQSQDGFLRVVPGGEIAEVAVLAQLAERGSD